jgi:hypothetical protein
MELSNPNDTGGPGHRPCTNLEAGRGPRENPVVTRLFRKRKIGLNEAGQSATDSQPEATKGKVSIFNHLEIGRPSASEAATVSEPAAQRFCHRFPCMVTPGFTGLCDYNSLAADGGVVKCDRELPGEARFLVSGVADSCHTQAVVPGRKPMYRFDLTVDSSGMRR